MADWFATSSANLGTATLQLQNKDSLEEIPFRSRRSPVICRNGCVASSQPLASSIGLDMLRRGANAAEAAIAVAGALCVTEPCSTGLGGDMFCLYYDRKKSRVSCINGSGCSPSSLDLDVLQRDCPGSNCGVDLDEFRFSPHSCTVPGAARGYEDLLNRHGSGKFSLSTLLEPAAKLAEKGFPVAGPITSYHWKSGLAQIKKWFPPDSTDIPLTVDGTRGPNPGEIMRNPDLARVLRTLGKEGATKGFYEGDTGKAIADAIRRHGGVMTMQDVANHKTSTFPEPISTEYRGVRVWQAPPNGQGVAGLIALSGLRHLEENGICPRINPNNVHKADTYHVMIEMMRLGFADARKYVSDPAHVQVSNEWLLDAERIGERVEKLFDPKKATIRGAPLPASCTVSFQVVDGEGNAISFVNSNFMGFGSGIVPDRCGFTLQNRGFGFSVDPGHPNVIAPNKRPYHTIIPGMLTYADTGELHSTMSNMGGNMQPQGHLQLVVRMLAGNLDPQAAVDCPRFCIAEGTQDGDVSIEDEVDAEEIWDLESRGHSLIAGVVGHARSVFGRAQLIKRDRSTGVLWAGSDGRADGCAMGY